MLRQFEGLAFRPADILLPRDCEYCKWSVVACDQYTSQPDYWQRVEEYVGSAPSALRLILPESCLDGPNVETDIMEVNNTMTRYLRENRFRALPTRWSTRTQYSGWEVYWSQATTDHFSRSQPWGSRMSAGRKGREAKGSLIPRPLSPWPAGWRRAARQIPRRRAAPGGRP